MKMPGRFELGKRAGDKGEVGFELVFHKAAWDGGRGAGCVRARERVGG
jgi:hypothetical protein